MYTIFKKMKKRAIGTILILVGINIILAGINISLDFTLQIKKIILNNVDKHYCQMVILKSRFWAIENELWKLNKTWSKRQLLVFWAIQDLNLTFMESLILAQDERWRRA